MEKFIYVLIFFIFYSCSSSEDRQVNEESFLEVKPAKVQQNNNTQKKEIKIPPKKKNIVQKTNGNGIIPNKAMQPYMQIRNETTKYKRKVSQEVDYFIRSLDGIVKLTNDQKSTLKELATQNISIKLNLQQEKTALKANPESDPWELLTINKTITYYGQQELKYLKKNLTPTQYDLYIASKKK